MTTSSRMVYAFARYVFMGILSFEIGHYTDSSYSDGGLPASAFFARIHPKLNVPLNSLYLNLALITIFGCIFLGSSR